MPLTQEQWESQMATKIIEQTKTEIYLDLPFFLVALQELVPKEHSQIQTSATDGKFLYYSSTKMIHLFKSNPLFLSRALLHSMFHCLFFHLWLRQEKNKDLWNLACDILVEYTIDSLNKPCTKRILSYIRIQTYQAFQDQHIPLSAANIYYWLLKQNDLSLLFAEFYVDDHALWPKSQDANMPMPSLAKKWQQVANQTQLEQAKGNDHDENEGQSLLRKLLKTNKNKRSYHDFLQKFAIRKEELQSDPDEFDLSYYMYGLSIYKNMPLLEAIETKEVKKIQDFVIVLDTSYSTSQSLIKRFLQETYTLLSSTDSFFKETHITLIQCDDQIRDIQIIKSQDEMEKCLSSFEIIGGQSTDFRPPFQYLAKQIHSGTIKKPSGLLYFTDGKGIFPKKRPDFPVAFVFIDDFDETNVPVWAMTQIIDPLELERKNT